MPAPNNQRLEEILGKIEIVRKNIFQTALNEKEDVKDFGEYITDELVREYGGCGAGQAQIIEMLFKPIYDKETELKEFAISEVSEEFPELEREEIDKHVLNTIGSGRYGLRSELVDMGKLQEDKVEKLYDFAQQLAYDIIRSYVRLR